MRLPQLSGTKQVKNLSEVFLQHHIHVSYVAIYIICSLLGLFYHRQLVSMHGSIQ